MRRELEKAFDLYTSSILAENEKTNPRKFFGFINSMKSKSSKIPILIVNGKTLESGTQKAEALSQQYESVFTQEPTENIP